MRRILVLGLVSLLVTTGAANEVNAQTTVSGSISEDTTWSPDESPYGLSGPVEVDRTATLTIDEGTTIEGSPGSSLVVEGTLLVQGTASNPVSFTNSVEGGQWDGIRFVTFDRSSSPFPDESSISGAKISGAVVGIEVRDRQPRIGESYFERNETAIALENPFQEIEIRSNVFVDNATAITGRTRSTVRIEDNDFWNNEVNLFMQPQDIYDCGPDEGTWEVHRNDILLGPANQHYSYDTPEGFTYRPFDVRTPAGSNTSPYTVGATDNWWGSTSSSEIDARVRAHTCCPGTPAKAIIWDPFSNGPNTPWKPEGEVLHAYSNYFHGDPEYVAYIRRPEHGRCFEPETARRLVGHVYGALGPPSKPKLALRREVADRCLWWSARVNRFVSGSCTDKRSFRPPFEEFDGRYISIVKFRPPLPRGRYTAFITGRGDDFYTTPGSDEIAFRVLGSG